MPGRGIVYLSAKESNEEPPKPYSLDLRQKVIDPIEL
jgi:hypothetical protein